MRYPLRPPVFIRNALLAALAMGTLGGCAVGPEFSAAAPEKLPVAWQGSLPAEGSALQIDTWWVSFNDPRLTELLAAARGSSPSVEAALARVRQARAQSATADAGVWPSVSLEGQPYSRTDAGGKSSIGITLNGNIGLFGYQTRVQEAALARVRSATHAWQGAHATLAADVADAYFARKQCLRDHNILLQDVTSKEKTLKLTGLKLDAGVIAPSGMARATATVLTAKGQVAANEAACARARNQLMLLTGLDAETLAAKITPWATDEAAYRAAVSTVPAELLTRRADVQAARESAAAASAEIGSARAASLPQLSISGAITAITGGAPAAWSLATRLVAPLFDGGRRAAAETVAEERYAESMAVYRNTLRQAVRDVEDALARVASASSRASSAAQVTAEYGRYLNAAETRYAHGAASLLELEDARQLHLAAELTLNSLRTETRQAHIALFRALGGGWPQQES